MDVKQAVEVARKLRGGLVRGMSGIMRTSHSKKLTHEDYEDLWRITIGFSRPVVEFEFQLARY